jgi:perosamine synthetase
MNSQSIPLSGPDITEADIDAVASVLRSSRLSLGPKLEEFEAAMAAYVGLPHGVGVNSGTAGLHLALLAQGIGPGDEVILPSFTFIAVANAVRYVGATPVFAEIQAETLNLDPAWVESVITARTRCILVVHTFGRAADMAALLPIARRNNLILIEDACEAIGAEIGGDRVGSFGDAAVFAFYPNKQITTGEGGMVVTPHAEVARRMAALRNHGRYHCPEGSGEWYEHAELGYNYRLSEMQCALGLAQFRRIDEILARREAIARQYIQLLSGHPEVHLPDLEVPGERLSWFVFVVRLAEWFPVTGRDRVRRDLAAQGIATGRYFAPIHRQPAYAAWREAVSLPVTEAVAARTLALPFFNRITDSQIEQVCSALDRSLRRAG